MYEMNNMLFLSMHVFLNFNTLKILFSSIIKYTNMLKHRIELNKN